MIKYRAYDTLRGKFAYWDAKTDENGGVFWLMIQNESFKPAQQYTGFKDKNGQEIYEADVLEYVDIYDRDKKKVSVSWNNRCGGHYTNKADRLCNLIHRQTKLAKSQNFEPDYPRIIGNVHENPELMEE